MSKEIIEGDGMLKQIGKSNRKTWEEIKKSFDKMSPEDIQRVIENNNKKSYPQLNQNKEDE